MSESPPEPQPTRLRRALRVSTFFAALVCLLAFGARAYLSDDRLKTMLEESGLRSPKYSHLNEVPHIYGIMVAQKQSS